MNAFYNAALLILAVVSNFLFVGCRKDKTPAPDPKPFYDEAYGSFSKTTLQNTGAPNGNWQDCYAIKAVGSAVNMTNTKSLASFYITTEPGKTEAIGIPVSQALKAELAGTRYTRLPKEVNHIIYDDKGNSLWLHFESISVSTQRSSMYVFNGTSIAIGGSGVFARAKGTIYLSGQIDFTNPAGSMLRNEGTVSY